MNKNMSRADARRADKSRRKTRSRIRMTPNCSTSDLCPVRLSAIYNEQVLRNTWMDCLSDLRAQLTEIKHGINVPSNMEAAITRMGILGLVVQWMTFDLHCCLEASLNKARIVKFRDKLMGSGHLMLHADQAAASAQGAEELACLIGLALEGLPSAEALAGIVEEFPVPFCLCSSCGESYRGALTLFQCRHCYSLLEIGRHSYVPQQPLC